MEYLKAVYVPSRYRFASNGCKNGEVPEGVSSTWLTCRSQRGGARRSGVRDFRRHDLEVTALGAPCVSRHAGEPRYVQIRHAIEHRIAEGAYAPGSAIPSEHELAAAFSTTRLTVRNAIDGLVERGSSAACRVRGHSLPRAARTPARG